MGFVLDVEGWGARPAPLQGEAQGRLLRITGRVLARCGLRLAFGGEGREPGDVECEASGTGDGLNAMLPADTDPTVVLPVLIRAFAAELAADNAANAADRIRMRMAVSIGLVEEGAVGFSGPLITEISRLVNSAVLRGELSAEPAADLAVAVADAVHSMIIKPGYPGIPAAQFRQARVTEKEFSGIAWIWISTRQWSMPAYHGLVPGDPRWAGGYRLLARIGASGGTAPGSRVFAAAAPGGGDAAVKVLDPAVIAAPGTRQRLEAGVLTGRLARGPYLAPALADGESPHGPWIASALVRGPSLRAVITETGPLPARSALWLAAGVAHALASLHGDDLTHGGLFASNVLLSADGPVATDAGVSRAALRAPSPASPADDVLALGSLAFFAATGRHPFRGDPADGIPDGSGERDLDGCPAELLPFVRACLHRDPALRPAAHELALRLSAASGPLPRPWLPPAVAVRLADFQAGPGTRPVRPSRR
jgi:hypothetical protein